MGLPLGHSYPIGHPWTRVSKNSLPLLWVANGWVTHGSPMWDDSVGSRVAHGSTMGSPVGIYIADQWVYSCDP